MRWPFSRRLRLARVSLLALRETMLARAARLRCGSRFATRRAWPTSCKSAPSVWPLTPIASRSSIGSSTLSRTGTPPALSKSSMYPVPAGLQSTSSGTCWAAVWKSSSDRSTPARRAMASRCTTAFVEPLSAARTLSALAKAAGVSMSRAKRPSVAKATARRPVATPSREALA